MKKAYGKPTISFESFAFSNNIAGSCSELSGIHSESSNCALYGTYSEPSITCKFYDNGYVVFYQGGCVQYPQENDAGNLCYHVSTDETRMFAS